MVNIRHLFSLAGFLISGGAYGYAAVVMDPHSAKILGSFNAHKMVYPASLTKMMSLWLLFEALEKRKITLDSAFVVSKKASQQPPCKLGVRPGQKISVRECILALAVCSSNDIAMVVGQNLGGFAHFVKSMNRVARQLKLSKTSFCNASGLHHPHQYTTVKDMALLLRALWMRFPQYASFLGVKCFTRQKMTYKNTNKLLTRVPGMVMGKTGYTQPAGWNLATLTVRNHVPVIVVVMGMKNAQARNAQVTRLIETFYHKPQALPQVVSVLSKDKKIF